MNRRQLLQRTGLVAAAAAISPLMQSPAFAAGPPAVTAYGASVCLGLGLGKRPPRNSTWFDQTKIALGVPGKNGAVPGTTLFGSIEEQAADPERATWGLFLWGGHSDVNKGYGYTVVPNLRTMSQKYPGAPYLILGLTNGASGGIGTPYYDEALAPGGINDRLASEHGENFFDVQAFLVNEALAASGITPTEEDRQAVNEYRVPLSLRHPNSQVHLNLTGQTAVAKQTTERAARWFM